MNLLRFLLMLAVIGYAGWLAWPFLEPLLAPLTGGGGSAEFGAARAGAEALSGGLPTAALWIGAVALYLIAALMLGSGNPRAAVAYFLGFIADAVLRLALDRNDQGGPVSADIAARSAEAAPMAATGMNPTWLVLGALLIVGVLVVLATRRRRRVRTPGQLAS